MPILVNAYSTLTAPPAMSFPHTLNNRRDLSDPELAGHLDGFSGYVWSKSGGQMTKTVYHVLRFIERVQQQISFNILEQDLEAMASWGWSASALMFFPDGTVRDPGGKILIDPAGRDPDANARIPYPRDAVERKGRSDDYLRDLGIQVNATLPPVISAFEVHLRTADETAQRMLALFLAAVRAESMAIGKPIPADELQSRCPEGFAALSPAERRFILSTAPDEQAVANFGWRYECAFLLQWALGLAADLPFPKQICDVPRTARTALDNNGGGFPGTARLRPVAQILEALDLHYRLNWACTEARVKGVEPGGGLDRGVVQERHHALNWLVRFENKDWDDVDTPT